MGIRRTLAELLRGSPDDSRLAQIVEETLASRGLASAADVAALEARVAKLEKKLDMAMGAVNAATAQLMQVKGTAEEASSLARQARQEATSARNTAESVAEGLEALEVSPAAALAPDAAPVEDSAPETCLVDGCNGKLRARGFCARHYNQWRRGSLPGFVGPEGTICDDERVLFTVDERFAGHRATIDGGGVRVDGEPVDATPAR